MKLNSVYYSNYSNIETAEELFLSLARSLLFLQKDHQYNPQKLDYIDITTNEEDSQAQIEISGVPCRLTTGDISIINQFNNDILETDAIANFPFGKTSHLEAVCSLGICLADQELNTDLNPNSQKIFSYTLSSQTDLGDFPLLLNIEAREFPLEYAQSQAWSSSRAKSWLSGSI